MESNDFVPQSRILTKNPDDGKGTIAKWVNESGVFKLVKITHFDDWNTSYDATCKNGVCEPPTKTQDLWEGRKVTFELDASGKAINIKPA